MITQEHLDTLALVRDRLRSGKIPAERFDMGTFFRYNECGSIHCIAGWCQLISPDKFWNELCAPTKELFYQESLYGGAMHGTPNQAAQAIDNFLTSYAETGVGDPRWAEVLGLSPPIERA